METPLQGPVTKTESTTAFFKHSKPISGLAHIPQELKLLVHSITSSQYVFSVTRTSRVLSLPSKEALIYKKQHVVWDVGCVADVRTLEIRPPSPSERRERKGGEEYNVEIRPACPYLARLISGKECPRPETDYTQYSSTRSMTLAPQVPTVGDNM